MWQTAEATLSSNVRSPVAEELAGTQKHTQRLQRLHVEDAAVDLQAPSPEESMQAAVKSAIDVPKGSLLAELLAACSSWRVAKMFTVCC